MEIKSFTKSGDMIEVIWSIAEEEKKAFYSSGMANLLRQDFPTLTPEQEALVVELENGFIPPPPPSMEERFRMIDHGLSEYLDQVAQEKGYSNRINCALRAGYPGPFQAEGLKFAAWMDQCNAIAYQLMDEVVNGVRPMPTDAQELIDLLSKMDWSIQTE